MILACRPEYRLCLACAFIGVHAAEFPISFACKNTCSPVTRGARYEGGMMTAEVFYSQIHRKFIQGFLGSPTRSAASCLSGRRYGRS